MLLSIIKKICREAIQTSTISKKEMEMLESYDSEMYIATRTRFNDAIDAEKRISGVENEDERRRRTVELLGDSVSLILER